MTSGAAKRRLSWTVALACPRVRAQQIKNRTALANQIRGFLGEYGIALTQGIDHLRRALPDILEDEPNGLIHGARSALRVAERKRDPRSIWISRIKLRRGPNAAAVALANKNARVIWARLVRADDYRTRAVA
jgi:transposase